ncbi:MAG: Mobile element protein, partial [uncultured Thermomicrobiales bacterium]
AHETTSLGASADGRRARGGGDGPALIRCLRPPPQSDHRRQPARRTRPADRPPPELRRADRPQRDPCLQPGGRRGAAQALLGGPPRPGGLHPGRGGAVARPLAPQPARLRAQDQPVDARPRRRGGAPAGLDRHPGDRRDGAGDAGALGRALAARQDLDHQPRPRVRTKKRARDRL